MSLFVNTIKALARRVVQSAGVVLALAEVDLFLTVFADMFTMELIGKDFYFRTAIITFTGERFEVSE